MPTEAAVSSSAKERPRALGLFRVRISGRLSHTLKNNLVLFFLLICSMKCCQMEALTNCKKIKVNKQKIAIFIILKGNYETKLSVLVSFGSRGKLQNRGQASLNFFMKIRDFQEKGEKKTYLKLSCRFKGTDILHEHKQHSCQDGIPTYLLFQCGHTLYVRICLQQRKRPYTSSICINGGISCKDKGLSLTQRQEWQFLSVYLISFLLCRGSSPLSSLHH